MKKEEMMSDWTIWPISVGTIGHVEKSNLTFARDQGLKIDVCSLMYLLRGGPELILVDTGMSDPDWAAQYHHPSTRDESQDPVKALAKLGVAPEEIRRKRMAKVKTRHRKDTNHEQKTKVHHHRRQAGIGKNHSRQ